MTHFNIQDLTLISRKTNLSLLLFSLSVSLFVALLLSWVALRHNPMGEYCQPVEINHANYEAWGEPCKILWRPLSELFYVVFIEMNVVLFLVLHISRCLLIAFKKILFKA